MGRGGYSCFGENVSGLARAPLAAATFWGTAEAGIIPPCPAPQPHCLRKPFACAISDICIKENTIPFDSAPRWKLDIHFITGKTRWKACNRKMAIHTFYHCLTFEAWTFWQPCLSSLLLSLFWSDVEAFPFGRLHSLPSACPLHPCPACLSGKHSWCSQALAQ